VNNLTDYPVVTEPSLEILNSKELLDYRETREDFLAWLLAFGKEPSTATGYSRDTVVRTAYRTDQFNRWVWAEEGYTMNLSHEHADAYMRELAFSEKSGTHKANTQKSIKRYFKWYAHERGGELWEPKHSFSSSGTTNPRDYLTLNERQKIREAALEYGSIPAYGNLTPEERDRWKGHLAQRFGKPKEAVTPADWEEANGWKYTSMTWASLDAGLRPVEVERAKTTWVDTENQVLRIPKEDSSKNADNWIVGITDRTAQALERWLEEREMYEHYRGTDTLWLTREGNPYQTRSLRYLLKRLCDIAEIPTENRKMSWYAIRHSVGTYMTREEDLAAAQAQLRHKSEQTTMKYDQAPVEDRRSALNKMEPPHHHDRRTQRRQQRRMADSRPRRRRGYHWLAANPR
jgi:site-specific recombinase XerD